ncbi:MAG: lipoate--protein ligase family protein [Lentisphaeria bacterium]|nr:lipoate--protein ligase family protein [Lentisphaeria bacterium]
MSTHDAPSPETWFLWQDTAHTPAQNMAIDEALLLHASELGRPVLRFYSWDRPTASIGYVQTYAASPHDRFAVVRRPTGGGVVYHDHDFTYTVVVDSEHWLAGLDRTNSYGWINRSVQDGLRQQDFAASLADEEIDAQVDRRTMVCFTNPTKYDIILDGRKVGGSAQRRTREGILHQGSIHFGAPLPMPRAELAQSLLVGFETVMKLTLEPFSPSPALLELADELARVKYGADDWNQRK